MLARACCSHQQTSYTASRSLIGAANPVCCHHCADDLATVYCCRRTILCVHGVWVSTWRWSSPLYLMDLWTFSHSALDTASHDQRSQVRLVSTMLPVHHQHSSQKCNACITFVPLSSCWSCANKLVFTGAVVCLRMPVILHAFVPI